MQQPILVKTRTPRGHLVSIQKRVAFIARYKTRDDLLAYMNGDDYLRALLGCRTEAQRHQAQTSCIRALRAFDGTVPSVRARKADCRTTVSWKGPEGELLLARMRREAKQCRTNPELAERLRLPVGVVSAARSRFKVALMTTPATQKNLQSESPAAGMALAA